MPGYHIGRLKEMKSKPVFLSIAGSDPSGGAGIQTDLKTAIKLDVYPCSAITSITAQNTSSVNAVFPLEPTEIRAQLEAVLTDFHPDSLKIGLVSSREAIDVIYAIIKDFKLHNIVLDPIVSPTLKSDEPDLSLCDAMAEYLFPLALLITPNLREKEIFEEATGKKFEDLCEAFLLKGGHGDGDQCVDRLYYYHSESPVESFPSTAFPTINFNHSSLYDQGNLLPQADDGRVVLKQRDFRHKRIATNNTHGTGCVLSSAIACFLAREYPLEKAVEKGIKFTYDSLEHSANFKFWEGNYGPALI